MALKTRHASGNAETLWDINGSEKQHNQFLCWRIDK